MGNIRCGDARGATRTASVRANWWCPSLASLEVAHLPVQEVRHRLAGGLSFRFTLTHIFDPRSLVERVSEIGRLVTSASVFLS